jgi:predicted dehydrogenase
MINIGIIGMGRMGTYHYELINNTDGLNAVAVFDKNEKRTPEIKDKCGLDLCMDIDKFLSIEKMDYVVVCTTNESHEALTLKALNAGKNVIVEKACLCTTALFGTGTTHLSVHHGCFGIPLNHRLQSVDG